MTNLNHTEAIKLAEAIYDHIDYYGMDELDAVVEVLTGDTPPEEFIQDTESLMDGLAALRKEGN